MSSPIRHVTPESAFEGAAFWIYPAEEAKPPFVFRWYGGRAYVSGKASAERIISIRSCPGLDEALAKLEASVLPSVQSIIAQRVPDANHIYIGHSRYVLKYISGQSSNEVRLESFDPTAVPWVSAAESVKARETECVNGS